MVGDFVRDKDAVTSTLFACEIAAQAKNKGSSVYAELLQIYVDTWFLQRTSYFSSEKRNGRCSRNRANDG